MKEGNIIDIDLKQTDNSCEYGELDTTEREQANIPAVRHNNMQLMHELIENQNSILEKISNIERKQEDESKNLYTVLSKTLLHDLLKNHNLTVDELLKSNELPEEASETKKDNSQKSEFEKRTNMWILLETNRIFIEEILNYNASHKKFEDS